MGKVYHILLIDDEQSDINLIESELRKLDIQVQIDTIQQEEQLIDRLKNSPPDLVISGYAMPTLTGTDALQIVQDRHPQLPFILVAGSIGEEKAINVMLQGASDYAMKQNLDRLGPAIRRELANYEDHKKQSRKVEKTCSQYENLVQSVNGIVWEADAETLEFLYVGPQSEQLLGYSPEEWVGEPNFWQQHIHPDDRREAIQYCQHKTQQSEDHSFEYRMLDADGEVVWLRDYVTVVTENGKPNRLSGLMVDVTREKNAERQRDKAYEIANIGHWELDLKNEELYWSNTVKQLHEVGPDYEPELDTALEFYKEGEDRQKLTTAVETAIETGESFEAELQIITLNGNEKWVRVVGETECRNGECMRIYGSTQDITERKEAERKLQKSLDLYESVSKATSDTIWDLDLETDTIDYSQNIYNIFGYERQQVDEIEDWWRNKIHPDDRPEVLETIGKALLSSSERVQMEYRFQAADGTYKYINDRAFIVEDQQGNPIRIIGAMRDVSDQKEAEQSLRKLYQKNRLVLESTADGIYGIDTEGRCTFINKAAANMLGYRSEECIGKNMHELIHHQQPNGDPYPESECPIFISKNKHESCRVTDEVFWRADGTCFNVEYTSNPMIEDGEIKGGVVAFSDITERKQQENELQESLEEKETLLMEIHHRVKNNLAVVSGMIQLQAFEEKDESLKQKLNSSIGRINTMGSIHELLYKSESFSRLEVDKNIEKLVTDIVQTFQTDIELDLNFDLQSISLNINQAIPFSLIINEVVTNVLKHAFDEQEKGKLLVRLKEQDNIIHIQIVDNGKGLPPDFTKFESNGSLGMQLIETLSSQLQADYSYRTVKGKTHFTLTFKKADVNGTGNSLLK